MCSYAFSSHIIPGHGESSLSGGIVDTPCTINTDSKDQAIDMGVIPINRLIQFGESEPISFNINLINCRWEKNASIQDEWRNFNIAFIAPSKGDYFTVNGNAKGIKLSIYDYFKNKVIPGNVLNLQGINSRDIKLKYTLYLVRDDERLETGVFHTLINFRISYY
ncbi:TPA: type 1 fimbrial protein [Proteus mirabilis]|nr:type 1 fimbrial protein [Proteus mirabilis]HEJ9414503.1 type 1 fimbrial protein [Proteus mirabilis]HEJ9439230.1 type 1 fimbrial protein [Proteus mirabilis]HEJ9440105.1 type 1 fimbrial protein [Proteus mirabilis]HEJ9660934.1 type 1 fimbrial protein [Proteus mirabilis]